MINHILAKKINAMADTDQSARRIAINNPGNRAKSRYVYQLDGRHLPRLKSIIEKYGLPTFDLVGKHATHNFWLLIQHADRDLEFQKVCLSLMERAITRVHRRDIAYLTDRIRLAQDKKQKFGTQYDIINGKLVLKPLLNKKLVTHWRQEYELDTLASQKKRVTLEMKKK